MKPRVRYPGWRWDGKHRARQFWLFGQTPEKRLEIEKQLQLREDFERLRESDQTRQP